MSKPRSWAFSWKHWARRDLVVCTNRCLSHNDLHCLQYFETFSSVGELTRVPVKSRHAEYAAHTIILHWAKNLFGCSNICPLRRANSPQFNEADKIKQFWNVFRTPCMCEHSEQISCKTVFVYFVIWSNIWVKSCRPTHGPHLFTTRFKSIS